MTVFFGIFISSCGDDSKNDVTVAEAQKIPLPDLNPEAPYGVVTERNIPVIRSDDPGQFKLYIDIIRPDSDEKFPALVYATAYRKELMSIISTPEIVQQGYALVLMDIFGTGSSEGGWEVLSNREMEDTAWIIDNWIPQQEWSNGKVGMYGPSYMGITTLHAAGRKPDHLRAIFPSVALADSYRDIFFQGGILNQQFIYLWGRITAELAFLPPTQLLFPRAGHWLEDIQSGLKALEEHHAQEEVVMDWLLNTTDSDFFSERNPMTYWDTISQFPIFITAGWWDLFTRGSMLNYTYLAERKQRWGQQGRETGPLKIIVGPWYHVDGAIGYGVPLERLQQRWFDWHLKACDDPNYHNYDIIDPGAPVMIYVLGREQWRREREWPLSRARHETLYLSGQRQQGDQNPSLNNGSLLWPSEHEVKAISAPEAEPTRVSYDPMQDREKFTGMKSRSSVRWWMGGTLCLPFAEDERDNEKFLLTFSTAWLDRDIEVTGPMVLRLFARSAFGEPVTEPPPIFFEQGQLWNVDSRTLQPWASQPDVHWTVNLNDVFPSGQVRNITSGWLAASHRRDPSRPDWTQAGYDPFLYPEDSTPTPPADGEVYEYVIEIWPASNIFQKNHQIRIDIAVTDYPHFLPSLVPSENEILHSAEYPSRLIIPVIDPETTKEWQWIDDPEAFFSGDVSTWTQ